MERLLQYLDDLDDAAGMVGLFVEQLRRFLFALFSYLSLATVALAGIWLATLHPPLALATSTLLFVMLLYRTVTSPVSGSSQTA
jgi:hypothetical protein